MTLDLWLLFGAVLWNFVLIVVAAGASSVKNPTYGLTNRDLPPDMPPWGERAKRASENMKENLPMFIALVLLVHVTQQSSGLSALGAEIFLGARVLHGIVYIAGITVVRTILYTISLVGMGMIAAALF